MYNNPSTTSISYTNQRGSLHEMTTTHKLDAVHFEVFPAFEILDDVPLIRPLGDQGQPVFGDGRTEEGEDVWVSKVFPRHGFSTESLHLIVSAYATRGVHKKQCLP